MAEPDNNLCRKHDGFKAKIEYLEGNVSELWNKWNKMQTLVLVSVVTLCLNLIAVIALLIRTWPKGG